MLKMMFKLLIVFFPCIVTAQNLNCELPWGGDIMHEQKVFAYQFEIAKDDNDCLGVEEERVCDNGVLSGTFQFDTCYDFKFCEVSGIRVEHGDIIELYREAITDEFPVCKKIERVCNNGDLEGDPEYDNYTCTTKQGHLKKIEKAYAQLYKAAQKTGDYSSLKSSVFTDYKRLLKSQIINKQNN